MIIYRDGNEIELTHDELLMCYKDFLFDQVKWIVQYSLQNKYYNDQTIEILTEETVNILEDWTEDNVQIALDQAITLYKRIGVL